MRIPTSNRLSRTLLALLMAVTLPQAVAQTALLKRELPESYIVRDGDTLWNIAGQFLNDPERWPEIWQPDPYLDNAELIYPGDELRVSYVGGSPRVLVRRGDRDVETLRPMMREQILTSSIPAIPREAIENSFTRNRIVGSELLEAAPYIVSNLGDNLAIATGDEVHVRGNWPEGTTSFEVYRPLREHYDPTDEERLLGVELEYLGFASIVEVESADIRRVLINNSAKEVRVGDRLLVREEAEIGATIFPTEPVREIEGRIIALVSSERLASQLDSVLINLGSRDSVEFGDVFAVSKEDAITVDEIERDRMSFRDRMRAIMNRESLTLPGGELGTLLVYRTFETMSYAVLLSSLEPISVNARVISP